MFPGPLVSFFVMFGCALRSKLKLFTSFEGHNSTITKIFPSTLRNTLLQKLCTLDAFPFLQAYDLLNALGHYGLA